MSFREKSTWISLLAVAGIYGFYFVRLALALSQGEDYEPLFLARLCGSVVLLVIVMVVLHIAAAVMSPKDASAPQDEREKLITLKANSASGYVLATGVVMTIGVIFLGVKDFLVINLLFLSLVLSEVYKNVNQIVLYRRGA